jgi:hypothetical protein
MDVSGDGAVTRMKVAVSGRFGEAPQHLTLQLLVLKHVVHQVKFAPEAKGKH